MPGKPGKTSRFKTLATTHHQNMYYCPHTLDFSRLLQATTGRQTTKCDEIIIIQGLPNDKEPIFHQFHQK